MRRSLVYRVSALVACVALAACSRSSLTQASKHEVTIASADVAAPYLSDTAAQAGGSALTVSGKPTVVRDPGRVVSIASGVAETIAALGLRASLVGRDIASESTSLTEVPVVTDAHALSAERTLAQKPTLLIVDASSGPRAAIDAVAKTGVQVIQVPEAWNVAAAATRIKAVAQALGVPSRADTLISRMGGREVLRLQPAPRVAFLYVRGTAAIYLVGGKGSGADSLIEAAAGIDVGARAHLKPFTPLSAELLAKLKPEVLLVMTKGLQSVGGASGLFALPGVAQTPAAKNKKLIAVDDGLLLAFGPATFSLVKSLHQGLIDVAAQ